MPYFCENPKCMFHVTVSQAVMVYTIRALSSTEAYLSMQESSDVLFTRRKHLWRDKKGRKPNWYFCDVCHEAVEMTLKV